MRTSPELRAKARPAGDCVWEIAPSEKAGMRVPARIYASEALFGQMDDGVFEQVTNVACLPGIVRAALCMPDGHWGYGFPIGGVAAFDAERAGCGRVVDAALAHDLNLEVVVARAERAELLDAARDGARADVGRIGARQASLAFHPLEVLRPAVAMRHAPAGALDHDAAEGLLGEAHEALGAHA